MIKKCKSACTFLPKSLQISKKSSNFAAGNKNDTNNKNNNMPDGTRFDATGKKVK